MSSKTYREQRLTLPANQATSIHFRDTNPNAFIIANNSNTRLYIGVSSQTSQSVYDLIVPAYGTRILMRPQAVNPLWIYVNTEANIYVGSIETEFDLKLITQTQEISAVSAAGLLGVVDVNNIINPLPAGTNNIGRVNVDSLPSLPAGANNIGKIDVNALPSLPAGTNNIGYVNVNTLPSIPAGNNNIGDVDVVSLPTLPAGDNNIGNVDIVTMPAIDKTGYTAQKITAAAAGDVTVKSSAGKVIAINSNSLTILLKDGTNEIWKGDYSGCMPISCNTSIVLNFSAAGDAYIVYK